VAEQDAVYRDVFPEAEIDWAATLVNVDRPRDALETLTRIPPRMDLPRSPATTRASYNKVMTAARAKLDRVEEALHFSAVAVELSRATSGPQSFETIDAMALHGEMLGFNGRIEEAKAILDRVLAANTRLLGADHKRTRLTHDVLRGLPNQTP